MSETSLSHATEHQVRAQSMWSGLLLRHAVTSFLLPTFSTPQASCTTHTYDSLTTSTLTPRNHIHPSQPQSSPRNHGHLFTTTLMLHNDTIPSQQRSSPHNITHPSTTTLDLSQRHSSPRKTTLIASQPSSCRPSQSSPHNLYPQKRSRNKVHLRDGQLHSLRRPSAGNAKPHLR